MSHFDNVIELKDKRWQLTKKVENLMTGTRKSDPGIIQEIDNIFAQISNLDGQILEGEKAQHQAAQRANLAFNNMSGPRGMRSEGGTVLANLARGMKYNNAADVPEEIRAVTSSSGSAAIQDPSIVNEIIYALQADNQLIEAGAQYVNIENYRQMPKVTAYPTAHWQNGEGTQITLDSALNIGSIKWELKDLAVRVRVSNAFLMDSSDRGKALLNESMIRSINDAIGRAVFVGTGANGQPTGIENFAGVLTQDASTQILSDWSQVASACRKLAAENVPLRNVSAWFSPTVWSQLALLESAGDGQTLTKPELLMPIRFMNPTTWIPETYDTNTTTRMFLGDFSKLVVGFQGAFELVLDQTRADYLETEFLIHMRADIQASHQNSFVYVDNISLT